MKIRIFAENILQATKITNKLIPHKLSFNVEHDGAEYIFIIEAPKEMITPFVEDAFEAIFEFKLLPNDSLSLEDYISLLEL